MRQTAGGKRLYFSLHAVFHPPDRRTRLIEQQIGRAAVAIVRQTNAASVRDKPLGKGWTCKAPNVGTVNMPVDDNWSAQRSVNRFQLSIGRFWRRCSPQTFRAGVH